MKEIKMFKKFSLLAIVALLSATASQAKVVGHYSAKLESYSDGGRWNDLNLTLLGWSCTGSQEIRYYEPMLDHKGREKEVEQKSGKSYTNSVFMMNNPVMTTFEHNMKVADPRLSMEVRENCSKTEYYTEPERYTTYDSDGRSHTHSRNVRKSRTRNAWMSWTCDTSNLPQYEGRSKRSTCEPNTSNFNDTSDLESLLVTLFRQKKFKLTLKLDRIDEQFLRSFNCEGNQKDRVVIGLKQGVGGHVGENDFVFHVSVDDRRYTFDRKTGSGLLDDEIEYCGAGKQVKVEVAATEKDLIFDDQYKPESAALFTRSESQPVQSQSIRFKRKTYFGEHFTDKVSTVVVSLREASRGAEVEQAEELQDK
jgi:hypothetical protein